MMVVLSQKVLVDVRLEEASGTVGRGVRGVEQRLEV